MAFNELAVAHGSLRKVPELSCSAIAVSNPKLCIVAAGASGVQTATGLGINEEALLSPAPLLAACAVAVRELDQCPVGSSSTCDAHAFAKDAQRSVTAAPNPALLGRSAAGMDLNRGSARCASAGVFYALACVA